MAAPAPETQPGSLDRRRTTGEDHLLVSTLRASSGVVLAALLACTKQNPAFDADTDAESNSNSADGSGETGGVRPTSSASGTDSGGSGGSGSSGSGGSGGSSGGTGGVCGGPGEACGAGECCRGCSSCMGGTCTADDSRCGVCELCGADGECAVRPPMTPCVPEVDPCAGTVYGLGGGVCWGSKPATGQCDPGGTCQADACQQGAALVTCDESCIIDPSNCTAGVLIALVDANVLCAQNGPTDACKTACEVGNSEDIKLRSCVAGLCTPMGEVSCGEFICKDASSCHTECESAAQCKPGHQCNNGDC